MKKHARAFTMIEVVVALAMFGIVLGSIVAVLGTVLHDNRRARVHSELLRDAAFASQLLNTEVRQAGLGVPRQFDETCADSGFNIRKDCTAGLGCTQLYGTTRTTPNGFASGNGTTQGQNFGGSVILANSTQVGIVADLPRPDAQYNTYGPLHTRPTGGAPPAAPPCTSADCGTSANEIMWHNENNGECGPGEGCSIPGQSLFFQGESAAAQICPALAAGATSATSARTCPWGMRRVLGGEHIQIVGGDFTWSTAEVSNSAGTPVAIGKAYPTGQQPAGAPASHTALQLAVGFDAEDSSGGVAGEDTTWFNQLKGDGPGGILGQGWVMTLDRVFFVYDSTARQLLRVQCWGDPDPNNPKWPDPTIGSIAGPPFAISSFQLTPAVTPPLVAGTDVKANVCVGPEVVARNVDSVTFSYFSSTGAALAAPVTGVGLPTCPGQGPATTGKNAIRRIDYVINFGKQVGATDSKVTHTIEGSIRLDNISPLN